MTTSDEPLTDRQKHVVSLLPAGSEEIATELGIGQSTARDYVGRIREKGVNVDYDQKAGVYFLKDEPEKRRLSTKAKGSKTREANEFRTELEAILLRRLKRKDPLFADPTAEPGNADFIAAIGDLHMGDVVEDERNNEVYNPYIAAASAAHFTQESLNRKRRFEQTGVEFDTGHLVWLGDEITGENIYEGQAFNVKLLLADQFTLALEILVQQAESFAEAFDTLVITAVPGNHGEIRSGYDSGQANMDLQLYRAVADRLIDRGHDNILFNIGEAGHYRNTPLRENKWRLHVRHGQHEQNHVDKTAASSRDSRGLTLKHDADAFVRGHHHTYSYDEILNQWPVITAPSSKPGSEFAEKIGMPDCSVHRKIGVTWIANDDRPVKDHDPVTDINLDTDALDVPTIDDIRSRWETPYSELASV